MTKQPFRPFGGSIRSALVHAVTEYDQKQEAASNKRCRYHNPYALAQYLRRVSEVCADIERGAVPRDAVVAGLHGPLLRAALKAIGEAAATKDEINGVGKGWTYKPVTRERADT